MEKKAPAKGIQHFYYYCYYYYFHIKKKVDVSLLRLNLYLYFFKVLIKKDFPFAKVPVPRVSYLNDTEPQVTLKCSFDFPTWDNVSFEVQWFVNGRGVTPTRICDNPNESTCDRRESLLGTSEYGPGDSVSHVSLVTVHTHCEKKNAW